MPLVAPELLGDGQFRRYLPLALLFNATLHLLRALLLAVDLLLLLAVALVRAPEALVDAPGIAARWGDREKSD